MKNSVIENSQELKHSFLGMEKALLAQAIEWAREVFKRILEQIDLLIQQHRPASLKIAHKRGIWYRTWLGPIRVNRRQYQDRDGKYRYLLDELMGMNKYQHTTFAVKEIACRLAGEMPFRKSAEILNGTTPIDLSHQTIHRLVQTALADSQDNADMATVLFEETGELTQSEDREANRLMIEADGVVLPLQRAQAHKAEVKLGIAYEGWQKVGKDRYRTVNKTYYADVANTDRFWAGMTLKLHQRYDLEGTQYVVGGDGAAWIKEGADYFGGRYQLCRYHLNRALCHALGHDRETLRSVQHHCSQGKFETAIAELKQEAGKAQNDKLKDIKQVIRYMISNASGLKDYRMNRSNIIPVKLPEKQVNRVVDRTMKFDYAGYFSAGLPAISGPHATRPWVELLKSISRIAV